MKFLTLMCLSISFTLAVAGVVGFMVKAVHKKRFSVADFLGLTATLAIAIVIWLASRNWSPR